MNIKYKNLRNDLQETLLEAGIKDAMVPLESTCNVDLIPGLGSSPGEENGYLLQYPGLENSIDYTFHGFTKSQTGLSAGSRHIAY